MTSLVLMSSPTSLPPKPSFLRLPLNPPKNVRKCEESEVCRTQPHMTAARKAGLRYEKAARAHLRHVLPTVELGVWWKYDDSRLYRQCQTDGVFFTEEVTTIIEIKKNHTSDSWWQLRQLYEKVLRDYVGQDRPINLVEMCQSFDSKVVFPEPVDLIEDIESWAQKPQEKFGVYRWRP